MARYDVTVYTGNRHGAGTDAKVYLELIGETGHSGEKQLDSGHFDTGR